MKYLIVGLGNIGEEYAHTRHNIGFDILDAFAEASNIVFAEERYGSVGIGKLKGHSLYLLKPSTFMNLSGNAVRYWMQKESIPVENVLVIVDDLALPFGTIRLKGNGSDGGHNGLKNIQEKIGTQSYPRLRFGISNNFERGKQVDFVLGRWNDGEMQKIKERTAITTELIKSFCLAGIQITMNQFNGK